VGNPAHRIYTARSWLHRFPGNTSAAGHAHLDVIDELAGPGRRLRGLRMELEVRREGGADTAVFDEPADNEVLRAVEALDQRRHTELTLIGEDGSYLAVGGGAGHYHVWMGSFEHDDRIVLQNAEAPFGEERLVVGGHSAVYPAGDVVDLATAADAVREFLFTGLPHPDHAWRSA
jgi:hypothetical protein